MENNQENHLVQVERERDPLDALREWYKVVPEELRRVEYEYFKYFRTQKMVQKYDRDHKETHGRFIKIPEYTKESEAEDWNNFRESFLQQKERKQKLLEIISACKADIPMLQDKIKKDLLDILTASKVKKEAYQLDVPQAFILGGSTVIGPRDTGKDPTSDIDIYLVMKDESFANEPYFCGHQIFDISQSGSGIKYQLIFIGENLKNFPSFMPIHILVQPHIVLSSNYSDAESAVMKKNIIDETVKNLPQIKEKLSVAQEELEKRKHGRILE